MNTSKRGSTSKMQVTSIRLEPELKERLREISGEQGYQTLIQDVLWQFVEQQARPNELLCDGNQQLPQRENCSAQPSCPFSLSDIRATFRAVAQQENVRQAFLHLNVLPASIAVRSLVASEQPFLEFEFFLP
jgi:hypothetical protein